MDIRDVFTCEVFIPLEPWASFERKWLNDLKKRFKIRLRKKAP